jgi:hypothetical protein
MPLCRDVLPGYITFARWHGKPLPLAASIDTWPASLESRPALHQLLIETLNPDQVAAHKKGARVLFAR